ncbi:hypothetical protein LTR37_018974 [Vermiconidia calcicola]|uniref:Uncharacterized protein n=1 Tax=Vermiconidia calcicola TaxID=1690605 RepID=A0ACC3MHE0_9PEZI|nr:hypothetical protein LTR37_018974 [Vermiconidia calcicola]
MVTAPSSSAVHTPPPPLYPPDGVQILCSASLDLKQGNSDDVNYVFPETLKLHDFGEQRSEAPHNYISNGECPSPSSHDPILRNGFFTYEQLEQWGKKCWDKALADGRAGQDSDGWQKGWVTGRREGWHECSLWKRDGVRALAKYVEARRANGTTPPFRHAGPPKELLQMIAAAVFLGVWSLGLLICLGYWIRSTIQSGDSGKLYSGRCRLVCS